MPPRQGRYQPAREFHVVVLGAGKSVSLSASNVDSTIFQGPVHVETFFCLLCLPTRNRR
ncbi:hypothetical protein F4804DRAFT_302707 [Jackrogersella minutella]|nr:hypothetical protein F4804DRAFT_302707 [Jackrogersella minutella]